MRQLIAGLASTPASVFTAVMLDSTSESLYPNSVSGEFYHKKWP